LSFLHTAHSSWWKVHQLILHNFSSPRTEQVNQTKFSKSMNELLSEYGFVHGGRIWICDSWDLLGI
jgi:hypothetical protein